MHLSGYDDFGIVIADKPGGGPKEDSRWLADTWRDWPYAMDAGIISATTLSRASNAYSFRRRIAPSSPI
jgi:hypothetical protein